MHLGLHFVLYNHLSKWSVDMDNLIMQKHLHVSEHNHKLCVLDKGV